MLHSKRWEDRFGVINASQILIDNFSNFNEIKEFIYGFWSEHKIYDKFLKDEEPRVRNQFAVLIKDILSL